MDVPNHIQVHVPHVEIPQIAYVDKRSMWKFRKLHMLTKVLTKFVDEIVDVQKNVNCGQDLMFPVRNR